MPTLFDAHVHLYPSYDIGHAMRSSIDTFKSISMHITEPLSFALFLTERSSENRYEELLNSRIAGLKITPTSSGASVIVTDADSATPTSIVVVPGKQVVSRERIEIHALATNRQFKDGAPLHEMIQALREQSILPILPWSPGKWIGGRGEIVKRILIGSGRGDLLISDPALRPDYYPTPVLYRLAKKNGVHTIFGTDPLPLPREEERIARYATLSNHTIDSASPKDFIQALAHSEELPAAIGNRLSVVGTISRLIALARAKKGY